MATAFAARLRRLERQAHAWRNPPKLYRAHQQNRVRFARDILHFAPDPWQTEALLSSLALLLNCARQTGKSTIVAILALHQLLYFAGSLVLIISPSLRQSSEVFRKLTDFYRSIENPIPSTRQTILTLARVYRANSINSCLPRTFRSFCV